MIVTLASLMPFESNNAELIPYQDKWVHWIMYATMAFLLNGVLKQFKIKHRKQLIYSVVLTSVYGIIMELLQAVLNTGRHFEYFDIIANIIGSISGCLLFNFFKK